MQTSSSSGKPVHQCSDCSLMSFCSSTPSKIVTTPSFLRKQHHLKKHQKVCNSKKTLHSLYMVKAGSLKASIFQPGGKEQILSFYLPGEIIGLEAINTESYPFAIESLTAASLCEISYENILSVAAKLPQLYEKLLQQASHRLNMGHYTSILRADQRLAGFLLELFDRLHCKNYLEGFILPMPRQAIGDYLGLAGETVIRILNRLEQQQVITIKNKHIKINHSAALLWLAQGGSLHNISH